MAPEFSASAECSVLPCFGHIPLTRDRPHQAPVVSVVNHASVVAGKLLAAAGEDQLWTVWDVEHRTQVAARRLSEVPLSDMSWHPTQGLAAIDEQGGIYRWTPPPPAAADSRPASSLELDAGAPPQCVKLGSAECPASRDLPAGGGADMSGMHAQKGQSRSCAADGAALEPNSDGQRNADTGTSPVQGVMQVGSSWTLIRGNRWTEQLRWAPHWSSTQL